MIKESYRTVFFSTHMCSVHAGPKIVFVPLYLTLFFVSPHFEDIMLFIHFVLENTLFIVTTWSSGQHVK